MYINLDNKLAKQKNIFSSSQHTYPSVSIVYLCNETMIKKCNNHGIELLFLVISGIANFFFQLAPRIGCLLAAIALHRTLLLGSLHAPLQFFDTTPTGRILARFSKDIDVLDTTLPGQVADMITCGLEVMFVDKHRNYNCRRFGFFESCWNS